MAGPVACFVGLATLDLVYGLDGPPRANTKTSVRKAAAYAGGPAANAAVAFAALGGEARLFTRIGRHPVTSIIREDLAARGVEAHDLAPELDGLPAVASVLVSPGGDRLAASSSGLPFPVIEGLGGGLGEPPPSCILVDGHLPGPCLDAARQARRAGIPVVLDGGSWKPVMADLLPLTDYAVCSEDCHPPGRSGPRETLAFALDAGARCAAVTRGEKALLWAVADGSSGEIEPPVVTAVDTLGAGDFFHGALCFALALDDRDFAAALTLAARVAALSVQSFGTRAWLDDLATLRDKIIER